MECYSCPRKSNTSKSIDLYLSIIYNIDMENLTKQQIVLLTLLVSFVTSIATGIVTVALMNQAPIGVTQTINRVIEKTIETVTSPKEIQVVKETVTVNKDDQIISAVAKNSKSIIKIYRTNTDPSADSNSMIFVGLGIVVSDDGVIATDNSLVSSDGKYFTPTDKNQLLDLSIVKNISGSQVALLKVKNDTKSPMVFSKVSISNDDLKLGQTIIYMGGEKRDSVLTGIVSGLSVKEIKPATNSTSTIADTKISSIETSLSSGMVSGGILLNLSGELVGIKSNFMDSSRTDFFAPASDVQDVLSAYLSTQKKVQ